MLCSRNSRHSASMKDVWGLHYRVFLRTQLQQGTHTSLWVSSSWLCFSSSKAWRRPRKSVIPYMRAYFSYSLGSTFLRSSMMSISSSSPDPFFRAGVLKDKLRSITSSAKFELSVMTRRCSVSVFRLTTQQLDALYKEMLTLPCWPKQQKSQFGDGID